MSDDAEMVIRLDAELQAIVPKYLGNRARDCVALRDYVANQAFAEAKRLGHNMKGTGGGYGFDEISRLGDLIEQAAAAGEGQRIRVLADELADFLARVKPVYS